MVTTSYAVQMFKVNSSAELRQVIKQVKGFSGPVTITLAPGDYYIDKPIILQKSKLKISGRDRDTVILNGGGMKSGASQIFVIEGSDVTIENLTLTRRRNIF